MSRPVAVLAAYSFAAAASDPPLDLRPLLKETGKRIPRRSNRFTSLALLGALRCCAEHTLPRESGLYLASAQGNVTDTVGLMHELIRDRVPPMPLNFINISSNIAGYSIAQTLGLEGRNCAVSRNGGAFDSAVELALMDLASGAVPMALVGVVEEYALPLDVHCRRLGQPPGTTLAEQSSWLLLAPEGTMLSLETERFNALESLPEAKRWYAGMQLEEKALDASTTTAVTAAPGYSESIAIHTVVEALQLNREWPLGYLNGDGGDGFRSLRFTQR